MKNCITCNKEIIKESKISKKQWENKKYCSYACRAFGRNVICENCEKEFYVKLATLKDNGGKYCSRECYWKKKEGISFPTPWLVGTIPWNRGQYETHPCKECGEAVRKWQTYCSWDCSIKKEVWNKGTHGIMIGRRGELSHLWKGGITPLYKMIRSNLEYKYWRSLCMQRDLYTCQDCKAKGVYLEVDHVIPLSYLLKKNNVTTLEQALACGDLWNIENGRTLCKECHEKTETYGVKASKYKERLVL